MPYELKKNNPVNSPPVGAKAKFEFQKDPKTGLVSFKIVRDSDKQAIFDTSFGGFVFLDQFIQISTHLMGPIYGFGGKLSFSRYLFKIINFKSVSY